MSVKTSRIIKICLAIIVIAVPLVLFSSGFFTTSAEKVLPGVEIMGTDLGGLNRQEGIAKLADLEQTIRATRVVLNYQGRSWPLLLNEVGFDLNLDSIMTEALNAGRQGSLIQRWQDRKQIGKTGRPLQLIFQFDEEKLAARVSELTREITVEPVEASFKIDASDRVTVVPGKDGTSVDLEALKKDIASVLLEGAKPEVELTLVTTAPLRTTAALEAMGVNGLLGAYTTYFNAGMVSRSYNISVAAKALDDLLVLPGQVVSFNDIVGPRSSEAGYKIAPVIVNNELVDGIGGGVCQVSTTLYNSVLLANLEIVERSNHSLPVSYVPIGRDATVVDNSLDLKFRNDTNNYLYIKSYVGGGSITFKIFGDTTYKKDVRINSWVTEEIGCQVVYETDPNLPKGEQVVKQEGASGFKAYAERIVSVNGVQEKREVLPYSDYSPKNKVIAVGTMEPSAKVAPSKPTTQGGQKTNGQPTGGVTTGGGTPAAGSGAGTANLTVQGGNPSLGDNIPVNNSPVRVPG
ncbi:VanW family protein [Pelotomaculum propionicicum]|uniref:Vancomycin B-type resistance protein VanW n=1 Tax=Pelotomaculum propionicicum TaxID=258475 RepID=A0A4Y7RKF4_9FIRM|nr:VanW family protein [Pelotomaculum propionicicum]NLI13962.1 vanomycin resistance protein VanB [Peptococcaceae bacterium]TEB09230.1 Vancomycin B-type resistance protein VanW [Pelotomaculum propionicicum]